MKNESICSNFPEKTFILVKDPRLIFARCLKKFYDTIGNTGIDSSVIIGKDCIIGNNVCIGQYSVIGNNVNIGDNTKIDSGVHIYNNSIIGRDVLIHSCAVIGMDGFSHIRNDYKELEKFPQLGNVVIEDDVEIGSNCCIARATIDSTIIGKGSKLDNLLQIGHNCVIGKNCFIVALTCLGGSVKVGDNCFIGIGSTLREGIKIGNNVFIGMGSVVTKNINDNLKVYGNPARTKEEWNGKDINYRPSSR